MALAAQGPLFPVTSCSSSKLRNGVIRPGLWRVPPGRPCGSLTEPFFGHVGLGGRRGRSAKDPGVGGPSFGPFLAEGPSAHLDASKRFAPGPPLVAFYSAVWPFKQTEAILVVAIPNKQPPALMWGVDRALARSPKRGGLLPLDHATAVFVLAREKNYFKSSTGPPQPQRHLRLGGFQRQEKTEIYGWLPSRDSIGRTFEIPTLWVGEKLGGQTFRR